MAVTHQSTHIGNVSGRVAAAGYGGGSKVWATENIALGHYSIDEIMAVWADEAHMYPVVIPAYCNMGAGVATSSDGWKYYVFQAAIPPQNLAGITNLWEILQQIPREAPTVGEQAGFPN